MRALVIAVVVLGACHTIRREPSGVGFLKVHLVTPPAGARGTAEAPLDPPRGPLKVTVEVTALGRDGVEMDCAGDHDCFESLVSFGVTPGWIPVTNPLNTDATPENDDTKRPLIPATRGQVTLKLAKGKGSKEIELRGLYGTANVWAEEWPEFIDGEERPSRYVAGISESLFFKAPTLQDLQYDPATMSPTCKVTGATNICDNTGSPLVDNYVETRKSRYVVTTLTNDGFFVSDLSKETAPVIGNYPGRFESMFVYNFSYPDDLLVGDVVTTVRGTVQDFTGTTQLVFPAWEKEDPEITAKDGFNRACARTSDCPDGFTCQDRNCRYTAVPLTEEICSANATAGGNKNLCGESSRNIHLESIESSRVEITRATMPTIFRNCDFNGDGDVPNRRPDIACSNANSGDVTERECVCKIACIAEAGCSELSAFHTYGQYIVTMAGSDKLKMNIVTKDAAPTVDPTQQAFQDGLPGALLYAGVEIRLRGTLRQTLPARPRWSLVAGEKADFCCLPKPGQADRCRDVPVCDPE